MYYYNTYPIGDIDIGHRWIKKGEILILDDDDDYRELNFNQWQHCFTQK